MPPERAGGTPTRKGEEQWPDNTARIIKQAFSLWDTDGSGTISKAELEQVMRHICPMNDDEIDMLMQEADANGNGVIEYAEFVDWLTKPATQSYGRAILDYSAILKPLFQVYDRDHSGGINFDDFVECHAILQSALKVDPRQGRRKSKDDITYKDPLNLQVDAQEAFRQMDKSQDGSISYTDFVSWMREHLDTQGMSASELAGFTSKLAKILSGIFHLNKLKAEDPSGHLGSEEEALLGRLLANLGKAASEFEHAVGEVAEEEEEREQTPSVWTPPPVGLSVSRLKGQHMKMFPVNTRTVDTIECDVLCVPMPDGADEPENRVWVAEVVRIIVSLDGKRTIEPPVYYTYNRQSFRWVLKQGSRDYETALDRLPPELAVYCVLKTQADFGLKIGWDGVMRGLKSAIELDLIQREDRHKYVEHMEVEVMGLMRAEGLLSQPGEDARKRCRDVLAAKFQAKPVEVMATLTRLQICKPSALWKSLVQGW